MATERKPVTIHYRKFSRPATVQLTLEQLIRGAMNSLGSTSVPIKSRYLERLHTVGSDNYFINTYSDSTSTSTSTSTSGSGSGSGSGSHYVFGDILHFTKGHLQALCKTANPNDHCVPVQQMKAPAQSEYVHSQMFWMLRDDHVFVIQSMSLRTEEFERYLDWFLKTKSPQLTKDTQIILDAKFDADVIGGDLEDIQEIVVGGVASPASIASNTDVVEQVRDVTQTGQIDTGRRAGWATATAILRELLGGDANVEALMRAVPADAELNVQVHIGYQTKKRKIDRVALMQLETGLRNLPDSQLQVVAKGARKAADGTIRLHHSASIRLVKALDEGNQLIGTLLDPKDVLRAMEEAYSNFVSNGKIQE